jgi:putative transcriptional regulator
MAAEENRVHVHIDEMLARRGLTLTELAEKVGITLANLSVLKNGRARAVRFTTLTALCDVLECQPGELFSVAAPAPSEELAHSSGFRGSARSAD